MKQTRREFMKSQAVTAAALAAGITVPAISSAEEKEVVCDGTKHLVVSVEQVAQFY